MSHQLKRFVVLYHEMPASSHRASHWDLMLEVGDALRTWALATEPLCDQATIGIAGIALPDHRKEYLEYEGPVPNDRGHVSQWDRGRYQVISESDDQLIAELLGEKLRGVIELTRDNASKQATEAAVWLLQLKANA